jgi:hypothetical protein
VTKSRTGAFALWKACSERRLEERVLAIHVNDRLSTFAAYNRTAEVVAGFLREAGLSDVERLPLPADGKARYGDWTMPLAWEAEEGVLEILDGRGGVREEIARYTSLPDHLIPGSAPTPDGGLVTELVPEGRGVETLPNLRKKILYTTRRVTEVKHQAAGRGVAGILSCYYPEKNEGKDHVFWNNAFSDRPGGWWQTAADSRLFGFSISPREGARIARLLRRRDTLPVRAVVKTRLHAGILPAISGCIPGRGKGGFGRGRKPEEILVISHLYERGAHDNASGAAVNLETARVLAEGICLGTIQPPARTIRFLFIPECYGLLAYATLHKERIRRTVAGLNLDGAGAGWPLTISGGLGVDREDLQALYLRLAQDFLRGREGFSVKRTGPELGDQLLSDPMLAVPTIWARRPASRPHWHSSLDTPDLLDYGAMRDFAALTGAYLLELSAGCRSIPKQLPPTACRAATDGTADGAVYRRTVFGPLSLDPLPTDRFIQEGFTPRWSPALTRFYWLFDGRRTVREVIARSSRPGAQEEDRLRRYLALLIEFGYLKAKARE